MIMKGTPQTAVRIINFMLFMSLLYSSAQSYNLQPAMNKVNRVYTTISKIKLLPSS